MFDHIDLRVPRLAEVASFYEALLPALGFTERMPIEGWMQFAAPAAHGGAFFGITESPAHEPNETRLAFRAASAAEVERISRIASAAGARALEGPMLYAPGYYAAFFEDPCGNRLEVCHRRPSRSPA